MKLFLIAIIVLVGFSGCVSYVQVKNCDFKYKAKSDKFYECEEL